MSRVHRVLDPIFRTRAAGRVVDGLVRLWSGAIGRCLPPADALRQLLRLDGELQRRVDVLAIALDGGVHAKHRIIGYHDFFLGHVQPGETVLDVGCGKGELAYDLAERGGAIVTGVDFSPTVLAFARERFRSERLRLIEADVLDWEPEPAQPFDVVVLSNVLEHIDDRIGLLARLRERARPQRFLIRVPVLEREWIVGLRRELGVAYFTDPTHFTEYSIEQLEHELAAAGLEPVEVEQRWGELWAVARPVRADDPGEGPGILAGP